MLKISVILIVYNRSELLKKSLLSLNYQSRLPEEVIVTDDGSTEDILSVLHELIPMVNYKLKYVRQDHQNFRAAKARNNGVRASENEYLIFIDQDIISTKNYIKTFVDYADIAKFLVSFPIRLTEEQSRLVDYQIIQNFSYASIYKSNQPYIIKKQFIKDYYSYIVKKVKLSKKGPKLRSGVFAIHRSNYIKVNGFDEMYSGWGNEDDDLGNRLYAANIIGFNPFWNEYPIHLFHPPYHDGGERNNRKYYEERVKKISTTNYKCEFGITTPLGKFIPEVIKIN